MSSFYQTLRFPLKCINREIAEIMNQEWDYEINIKGTDEEFWQSVEDNVAVEDNNVPIEEQVSYWETDNGSGDFSFVNSTLKKYRVPYNAYCSGDYEYNPEEEYYRDEEEGIINFRKFQDGSDAIPFEKVDELINKAQGLSKNEIIAELNKLTRHYSLRYIQILEDIAKTLKVYEPVSGSKIDQILERFDKGEISRDEAFKMIADIKKEDNLELAR